MLVPLLLSVALLTWSALANLLIGEHLYVLRNLALCVGLLILARATGVRWSQLGFDRATVGSGARWGGAAALVVLLTVVLAVLVRDLVPLVDTLLADRRAQLDGGELLWASLVRIPLGTAVFEEIAFRGVLLGALLQVTSTPWAVTWSSLVFGLWHIAPTIVMLRINEVAPASPQGLGAIAGAVAITAVAGVLFSVLRLLSGSLLAPVLAHWATNGVGLLAAALVGDDTTEATGAADEATADTTEATGAADEATADADTTDPA